ncbi:MAG: OmpH family outer membrane protein [Rhodothermaceae bacterium]
MKKAIFLTILLLASVSLFAQTQKIGYVNVQTVMEQYPAAIKANSDLEALVTEWRTTLANMQKELQNVAADYQKKAATMSKEAQDAARKDLMKREQDLQQFNQQKFAQPNGEIFVKQAQLMEPINKRILAVIEQVAKEEGLKFIVNKTDVNTIFLYADAEYDMTFKVIDKLKRGK